MRKKEDDRDTKKAACQQLEELLSRYERWMTIRQNKGASMKQQVLVLLQSHTLLLILPLTGQPQLRLQRADHPSQQDQAGTHVSLRRESLLIAVSEICCRSGLLVAPASCTSQF